MKGLYILLSDQIANRKERGLLARQKTEDIFALQGSLWQLADPELRDVREETLRTKSKLALVSLEFDGVILQCPPSEIHRLDQKEHDLLLAVNTCLDRFKVFRDKDWLQEGLDIEKEDVVYVIKYADLPDKVPGKVRYKGPLPGHNGTWFGVELSAEYQGKGTSDGTLRKKRYFTCPLDTGIFVGINKIRICPDPSHFKEWTFNTPVEHEYEVTTPPPLAYGERVVWMSDIGPEVGTVKWIGHLYDTRDKEWTVGVEFDNAVGTGTGKYKDRQLFRAKQNHASLVPILGLIKASEFFGNGSAAAEKLQVKMPEDDTDRNNPGACGMGGECDGGSLSRPRSQDGIDPNSPTLIDEQKKILNEIEKNNREKQDRLRSPQSSRQEGAKTLHRQAGYVRVSSASSQELDNEDLHPGNNVSHVGGDDVGGRVSSGFVSCSSPRSPYSGDSEGASQRTDEGLNPLYEYQRSKDENMADTLDGYREDGMRRYGGSEVCSDGHGMCMPPGKPVQPGLRQSHMDSSVSRSDTGSSQSPGSGGSGTPPSANGTDSSLTRSQVKMDSLSRAQKQHEEPLPLDPAEVDSDLEIGSMVEVLGNLPSCQYGVIRWIGYLRDKHKPIAGLEMEEESSACTDGTFAGKRLFNCPPRKAFFVYLHKCRRDPRFEESGRFIERSDSLAFGSMECPDIVGTVAPPLVVQNVQHYCGKQKGIQGHHNSCYLDATLFSMFAFTLVFDTILHRPRQEGDQQQYEEVQQVLREGIVNPLRKNFYVRADKVLKLRKLLDKLSSVEGLMSEEKDPEEFLSSLLQQILKAESFLRLSNGQESFFYQLFFDKDERIVLPTTQQLLALSFLQSDIKLAEVPGCLILQMPRFGKNYKMYKRIVPSLYLDITDILDYGPRECYICGEVASWECKECYTNYGQGLDQIAYCNTCLKKSHGHSKRATHRPRGVREHEEFNEYIARQQALGNRNNQVHRETMELFAVLCIETSHYVAFVKCGSGPEAPWVFFDSMADRMGEQHGYNIPEVKLCPEFTEWLSESKQNYILSITDDRLLPELMKRVLCDSYMCFYQSPEVMMYK